jgi:hypothetical protein
MSEGSKNLCFEIAVSHLQWFKEDRNEFLESTVTDDRTPVQHLTHETKQAGMEWERNFPGNSMRQLTVPDLDICYEV